MSRPNYTLPAQPNYQPNVPALLDQDPASATNTFNPLFQRLITNIHSLMLAMGLDSDGQLTIGPEAIPQDGTAGTGTLVQLLGRFATMLQQITGQADWWIAPEVSMYDMLAELKQIAADVNQNLNTTAYLGASFLGASFLGATAPAE